MTPHCHSKAPNRHQRATLTRALFQPGCARAHVSSEYLRAELGRVEIGHAVGSDSQRRQREQDHEGYLPTRKW